MYSQSVLAPLDTDSDSRFIFFSQLQWKRVRSADGHDLGRVADLAVIPGELYPPVESVVVRSWHGTRLRLLWAAVAGFDGKRLQLLPNAVVEPMPDIVANNRLLLADGILDRQIVDVEGAKLERVNDIHFLLVKGILRLAHVDVGFRGLVRRMGWERAVDLLVKGVASRSSYLRSDVLLSWKYIQPLGEASGRMRLDTAQAQLAELHPADLAEIIEDLDREQRLTLFSRLDTETAAEALQEVSPEISTQIINEVPPELAADLLEEMAPDEAADVLQGLPEETQSELLGAMERPEAREVRDLLQYDKKSAGGLMTPDVVAVSDGWSVAQTLDEIRRRGDELSRIYEIFVIDGNRRLRGQVTLKDLVVAQPEEKLVDVMREVPDTVGVDAGIDEVAELAAKYKVLAVPVIDAEGALLGMVTLDDILPQVIHGN